MEGGAHVRLGRVTHAKTLRSAQATLELLQALNRYHIAWYLSQIRSRIVAGR